MWNLQTKTTTVLQYRTERTDCECSDSYRDNQWCDPAGEAGEQPANVKHPHVLCCNDDGETKDKRQRAEHQAKLPPNLLHHPAPQQPPYGCSHCNYGLKNKTLYLQKDQNSTRKWQLSKKMSYPKPGGLVSIQLQSRVSNGGEFRNDGRAVPKDKPETHGTQNWCKSGQVQLLVLHFTKGRNGKKSRLKREKVRSGHH